MLVDSNRTQPAPEQAVPAPVVALVANDAAFLLDLQDIEPAPSVKHFKCSADFFRELPTLDLRAIVWDAASVKPDWPSLALLDQNAMLLVVADPCPAPDIELSAPLFALPAGANRRLLSRAVRSLVTSSQNARRLHDLQEPNDEADCRVEDLSKTVASLKERLSFHELQRTKLSEMVRKTAYLGQVSKDVNCLDFNAILDVCATKVPVIVGASRASVYFVEEGSGDLVLHNSNHSEPVADRIEISKNPTGLMALAVERKATLLIRDMANFRRGINRPIDDTHAAGYRSPSCIVVPLVSDGNVMAVVNLSDKTDGTCFDEVRDLPLVDHMSQFISIALRNCQLYGEASERARTDGLTGCFNHKAFFDELAREIERSRRNGTETSVILMDVDKFKLFNDGNGHQVGDAILREVARAIRSALRTVDITARYGGDEFAVILGGTGITDAKIVAQRIRRAVASNPVSIDGRPFSVTVSVGVAERNAGQTAAELVADVDAALYIAKSLGRNAVAAAKGGA